MPVRSLTFATLLALASPLFAANADPSPLEQELNRTRPLIIIVPTTADPTLKGLQEALKDPATKAKFDERQVVLYSVAGMVGKRDGKDIDQQSTMALIRLATGSKAKAGSGTPVVLVDKAGNMHPITHDGSLEPQQIFDVVDQLPAEEKALQPPTVADKAASQAGEPAPGKDGKPAKPVKPAKPLPPPKPLDD